MAKYDPLRTHLRRQSAATYEMSFRDIECVLTRPLPNSAARPEWWANEIDPRSRHVQCRAWLDAGYTASLRQGADSVRFERVTAAGVRR
jgi:hypothetical protein